MFNDVQISQRAKGSVFLLGIILALALISTDSQVIPPQFGKATVCASAATQLQTEQGTEEVFKAALEELPC